jgi:hypothetical protein
MHGLLPSNSLLEYVWPIERSFSVGEHYFSHKKNSCGPSVVLSSYETETKIFAIGKQKHSSVLEADEGGGGEAMVFMLPLPFLASVSV